MGYLVVDDEKIILDGMQRILQKIDPGAAIYVAQNPYAALDIVQKNKDIEIVFTDVDMPGINGLKLAGEIHKINENIGIVFATGFAHYSLDAWQTEARAFMLKPVEEEDVLKAMKKVRIIAQKPADSESAASNGPKLTAKCFGNFEIFYEGVPVHFTRKKSKEMLAYLIDRRGATISTGEIRMALWSEEDDSEEKKGYVRVLANDIRKCFEELDIDNFLLNNTDCYSIDIKQLQCDYYDFLDGNPAAKNSFRDEYMVQYPWSEMTLASLMDSL